MKNKWDIIALGGVTLLCVILHVVGMFVGASSIRKEWIDNVNSGYILEHNSKYYKVLEVPEDRVRIKDGYWVEMEDK